MSERPKWIEKAVQRYHSASTVPIALADCIWIEYQNAEAREREPADAALAEAVDVMRDCLRYVNGEKNYVALGLADRLQAFIAQHAAPTPEPAEPPLPEEAQEVLRAACRGDTAFSPTAQSVLTTERLIRRGMEAEQAEREGRR